MPSTVQVERKNAAFSTTLQAEKQVYILAIIL